MTEKSEREDVFLAKTMCERKGKKEGIPLGQQYWNRPEWKSFFKHQMLAANRLLKIYPFEVITASINHKKASWVFSLFYPGLKDILEQESFKYERKKKIEVKREENKEIKPEIVQSDSAPVIFEGEIKNLRNKLD